MPIHKIPSKLAPPVDQDNGSESAFKQLLLEMAQQRSCSSVLQLIVDRLAAGPRTALARIWLVGPGDICNDCHMRQECPDQSTCLHLKASAGSSRVEEGMQWRRIDGFFRRFPIGVRKVGHIASTGEPVEVADVREDSRWIAHPDWVKSEGIRGLGGQPLIYKGDVLGVLAVFYREPLLPKSLVWLRMIADHAAIAIANARAFEEIEQLRSQLELENTYLREEVQEAKAFGDIVGHSPALKNILEQIDLVAPTEASVLISGESGTGKELVAQEIHRRSARNERSLIKVNCASIPADLYESEFFGHVRGAFTGAVSDRAGRFEAANEGTLFLDEVGEIPLELQSKLLRVLQEGQYERVGDERTRDVDVRVIAASNRDLKAEVDARRFRQDLYYRLNVFPIEVAPLRDRTADIPLLANHFLESAAKRLNRPLPRLTKANVLQLQAYSWPGNVRELQNVIERSVILARGGRLEFDLATAKAAAPVPASTAGLEPTEIVPDAEMRRRERDNLAAALEHTDWKVSGAGGAAELLGVKPTTLTYRIKNLRLKRPT